MVGTWKLPRFPSLAQATFPSSVGLVHVMLPLAVICLVLLGRLTEGRRKNLVSKALRLSVDTDYERRPVYTAL